MKLRNIEILENDSNKKGDLFGRLMSDFFHALGYDEPRLNIHKSGREIDLTSQHRTEQKIAIAECKAHSESIGGADINKFVGVIDAEKRKLKKDKALKGYNAVGYFISLSGFRETAIEQENDCDNKRVILIKPEKIVTELVRGKILVSFEEAVGCLSSTVPKLTLINHADLVASNKGWVWAFYYSNSNGQKPSHFALVHAEGKPLFRDLAEEIISIDINLNKVFEGLALLNKEESTDTMQHNLKETGIKYFKYLENELGEIHFEGLPTDKEAGSVKVKLENIFVPLHLNKSQQSKKRTELDFDESKREGIGDILNKHSKLAILAKPGGGKSTLIKRIAIAYAFPERRKLINDKLPEKILFPIFLRCRELGEKVTLSITEIINAISTRAEINSCADEFSILVSKSLQQGTALLLIDGLDEIAEDKNRISFVNQLRTFVATYPTINIIVTSREAGFRVVADFLATYCENYTVSNLIESEIKELCIKWHKAIIDESANTAKEANKLSELIMKDNRIKALAKNPLLLTTLLFVKRWAGYLPTKRSVLYQEMIKLLLVTWNVEGHEILDIEEAEPQLAFVAYWMTKQGQQTITADELNSCLIEARKQMPEILGYTNVSPSEFIKRVESRSSLLIMSGYKRLDSGNTTAVYEFLHLSFQEYLTAKAIVKRFIPKCDSEKKVVDIIKPNINSENWKEVIPLAAVLLERDTKDLIECLISESKIVASKDKKERTKQDKLAPSLLGSCLANEIQISPDLLGTAIEWYAKNTYSVRDGGNTEIILKNKFGTTFRKRIKECFIEKYDDKYVFPVGSILADIFIIDVNSQEKKLAIKNAILSTLRSEKKEDKCSAILGMMNYAFGLARPYKSEKQSISDYEAIFDNMLDLLKTNDPHYHFSICWCLAWSGQANIFPDKLRIPFTTYLVKLWIKSGEQNMQRVTSWALSEILTPSIPKNKISKIQKLKTAIYDSFQKPNSEFDQLVSIYLGTIIGECFEKKAIIETFKTHPDRHRANTDQPSSYAQFVKALGINIKEKK
ncbi:MAG: hypothetical protein CVU54_14230 [Deltaproteobacteria bacterium HGW-Deltaproteobacteria-12]|jgi:hypothetical protein|nr:MAG: hypothetical protein CVU54_14230 [Deltaproteobacteria bacterium HGW-Deltaproteobacteria-12]